VTHALEVGEDFHQFGENFLHIGLRAGQVPTTRFLARWPCWGLVNAECRPGSYTFTRLT
jgi:hypothetical protein